MNYDLTKLKISEIKALFLAEPSIELVMAAQADARQGVQQLAVRYMKQQAKVLAEQQRLEKLYEYEGSFYEEGLYHVAGVDEVGRGPIAGPVTVAAVILPPHTMIAGINDSKKLLPEKREALYDEIMEKALAVSCISYEASKIDALNIYEATREAMYEALRTLKVRPEAVLVDAMPLPKVTVPVESLIKGDAKSISIAAASIIAKVTRDRFMEAMEEEYPGYGFAVHKGYCTEQHKEALADLGITPLHRRSFEPVKSMVQGMADGLK